MLFTAAAAQSVPAASAFAAVSIKLHDANAPSPANPNGITLAVNGNRWQQRNVTPAVLIELAYHRPHADGMIVGGPAWMKTTTFDVVATSDSGAIGDDQLRAMAQTMLADRFQLRMHRETKDVPATASRLLPAAQS